MSEQTQDRMSDRLSKYVPDNARKNVRHYVKIVFQGGDHSKKVIYYSNI